MLKIKNLTKKYSILTAVDNITLDIEQGEVLGLLGPNGAGKSTTISMISTLIKPTAGEILFRERDIVKNPKAIQPYMGIVPQEIALYDALSGIDNMKFWGKAYGIKRDVLKTRIREVSDIIGIDNRLKDKVSQYSGGMKRRLNIGVALLHNPEIIIMDEPTVGVDPQSRNHILNTVKNLNDSGVSVIYTSHYMDEVETLCKKIHIMDEGKIIASGSQKELIENMPSDWKIPKEAASITRPNLEDVFLKLTGRELRD